MVARGRSTTLELPVPPFIRLWCGGEGLAGGIPEGREAPFRHPHRRRHADPGGARNSRSRRAQMAEKRGVRVRKKSVRRSIAALIDKRTQTTYAQLNRVFRRRPSQANRRKAVLGQPDDDADMQNQRASRHLRHRRPLPRRLPQPARSGWRWPREGVAAGRSSRDAKRPSRDRGSRHADRVGRASPIPRACRRGSRIPFRSHMGRAANRAPRRHRGARRQSPSSPQKVQQDPSDSERRQP